MRLHAAHRPHSDEKHPEHGDTGRGLRVFANETACETLCDGRRQERAPNEEDQFQACRDRVDIDVNPAQQLGELGDVKRRRGGTEHGRQQCDRDVELQDRSECDAGWACGGQRP
jgi:hypothetical protein